MSIWVSSIPSELTVVPGEEVGFVVRVGNTGSLVDQVSVGVLGEPAEWSVIDPPVLQLLPGGEADVEIVLRPPRDPSSRAGRHTLGISVSSREDPSSSSIRESSVDVAPFEDARSGVEPSSVRTRRDASFVLSVDNGGNHVIDVAVDARDPEGVLAVTATPTTLRMEAGERQTAAIETEAPALTIGRERRLTVEIGLTMDGLELSEHRATVIQTPRFPAWLLPIGAVVAVALVAWLVSQGSGLLAAALALAALAVGAVRALRKRSKPSEGEGSADHPNDGPTG